jgi:hypothetical protein
VAILAGQLLRGVHPESYEILPRHFVQGLGSHAQNDMERRAQDDIGGKIAELVPSLLQLCLATAHAPHNDRGRLKM